MRGVLLVATIIVAGCGLIVAGCANYHTYRYRLTLEVETPAGIKTGTGVYEVSVSSGKPNLISPGGTAGSVKGEAISIDLGPSGRLFALLTKGQGGEYQHSYVGSLPNIVTTRAGLVVDGRRPDPPRYGNLASFTREVASLKGKIEVLFDELPMLVRFADATDPKSVELVLPANLEAAFGPGIYLRRAWIEMTSAHVTSGLEKHLPWITSLRTGLDGTIDHYPYGPKATLANALSALNFIRR